MKNSNKSPMGRVWCCELAASAAAFAIASAACGGEDGGGLILAAGRLSLSLSMNGERGQAHGQFIVCVSHFSESPSNDADSAYLADSRQRSVLANSSCDQRGAICDLELRQAPRPNSPTRSGQKRNKTCPTWRRLAGWPQRARERESKGVQSNNRSRR